MGISRFGVVSAGHINECTIAGVALVINIVPCPKLKFLCLTESANCIFHSRDCSYDGFE